jgi:hypothetical protein
MTSSTVSSEVTLRSDSFAGTLAAAVLRTDHGWHAGLLHATADGVRLLHLRFHCMLSRDVSYADYFWIEPRLANFRQRRVAAMCEHVWDLYGSTQEIPYAFKFMKSSFSPDGKLLLGASEHGLTCSTFILALFRGAAIELVEVDSWKERPGDDVGLGELLEILADHAKDEHVRSVEEEKGCARFRPAEIAASTAMAPLPVSMVRADPIGTAIEAAILKSRCEGPLPQ